MSFIEIYCITVYLTRPNLFPQVSKLILLFMKIHLDYTLRYIFRSMQEYMCVSEKKGLTKTFYFTSNLQCDERNLGYLKTCMYL